MKRFISSLLAVMFLLTLSMPCALAADEKTSGDYKYQIKGNGTIAITEYLGSEIGTVFVPDRLDGYKVTEIGRKAFSPSWIHPSTREPISPQKIVLPDTITIIGDLAFAACDELKAINIPKSVKSIGGRVFLECNDLRISLNSQNEYFALIDDVLYNKANKELIFCPGRIKEYVVPDGITSIADGAFSVHGFDGYPERNIILPDTVKHIGFAAFSGYKNKQIVISANVESIGEYAFSECNLKDEISNEPADAVGNIIFENKLEELPEGCFQRANIRISQWPQGLEKIGESCFARGYYYFDSLPETLKVIGEGAFRGAEVNLPNGSSTLALPDGLERIEREAFMGCDDWLDTLIIPATVKHIDNVIFPTTSGITVVVEEGSYADIWANENGYSFKYATPQDLSWLE